MKSYTRRILEDAQYLLNSQLGRYTSTEIMDAQPKWDKSGYSDIYVMQHALKQIQEALMEPIS